jgi:hypothetical protein
MNKIISILICCFIAGCLFVSCEQPDIFTLIMIPLLFFCVREYDMIANQR